MEIEWKKNNVEDGWHVGKIVRVSNKTTKQRYEYTDVFIQLDDTDFEVKYGCPSRLSENSRLGKLLKLFVDPQENKAYDPEVVLVGKLVEVNLLNETTSKGTFANVVAVRKMEEPVSAPGLDLRNEVI